MGFGGRRASVTVGIKLYPIDFPTCQIRVFGVDFCIIFYYRLLKVEQSCAGRRCIPSYKLICFLRRFRPRGLAYPFAMLHSNRFRHCRTGSTCGQNKCHSIFTGGPLGVKGHIPLHLIISKIPRFTAEIRGAVPAAEVIAGLFRVGRFRTAFPILYRFGVRGYGNCTAVFLKCHFIFIYSPLGVNHLIFFYSCCKRELAPAGFRCIPPLKGVTLSGRILRLHSRLIIRHLLFTDNTILVIFKGHPVIYRWLPLCVKRNRLRHSVIIKIPRSCGTLRVPAPPGNLIPGIYRLGNQLACNQAVFIYLYRFR